MLSNLPTLIAMPESFCSPVCDLLSPVDLLFDHLHKPGLPDLHSAIKTAEVMVKRIKMNTTPRVRGKCSGSPWSNIWHNVNEVIGSHLEKISC